MNTGKTIGLVLVTVGIVIGVVGALIVIATYLGGQTQTLGGVTLGIACSVVLAVPIVQISDVALELDTSRDQVKTWVYDLVHKGLFAGYINWDDGTLYSRDAAQLRGDKCPSCGGELELAGKGVVQCPFCGAEIFLTG